MEDRNEISAQIELIAKLRQTAYQLNKMADSLNELADGLKIKTDVYNQNNLPSGLQQIFGETMGKGTGKESNN